MSTTEYSMALIKPDAIEKDVVRLIRSGIESAGMRVTQIWTITFDFTSLMKFYGMSEIRYSRADVAQYLCALPLGVWIIEGNSAIDNMMSLKGVLRIIYGTSKLRNLLHCPSSEDEFKLQYNLLKLHGAISSIE